MNLIIWGKGGGMSKSLKKLAKEDPYWYEILCIGSHDDINGKHLKGDVSIDFTHPSSLDRVLNFSLERKCPLVIGTTGYSEGQMEKIKKAAEHIPIVYSANMSLGMNLLFSLTKKAASVFKDTVDVEVLEAHHKRKPDAPSGTALTIVKAIEEGLGEERNKVYGRVGDNPRQQGEIGIHSLRGGNIVSHHEAWFIHEMEKVTLVHEAFDNDVFSKGALEAAKFVLRSKPGLYDMTHVLGLEK